MRWVMAVILGLMVLPAAGRVQAQAAGQVLQYQVGWNMVGAPPGTDLSSAEALDFYGSNGYSVPSGTTTSLCQGVWAYFSAFTEVHPTTPPLAVTQTCPLQPGWTMIANPYLSGALLPSGTTAFYWVPGGQEYVPVTEIPLGAAVWIYSASAGSVTLRPALPGLPGATVSISVATPPQTVHVGETIVLTAAGRFPVILGADPHYLVLEEAATDGTSTTWRYRAITTGSTTIVVSPSCAPFGCLAPSYAIRVDILPVTGPATIVITPTFGTSAYTLHVGETIELQLLLFGPGTFTATVDPAYLSLQSATSEGAEPVRYDWRWLATVAGSTKIVVDRHGPDVPGQYVIDLDIQP